MLAGVKTIKKTHKIISTTPVDFKANDKVLLIETGYKYRIDELERLVSSEYAQIYGLTYNDSTIPKALTLV